MTETETARMELAFQIEKYLHENGIGKKHFAKKCGVAAKSVEKALLEMEIPISDMQKVCNVLGLSLDSLRRLPVSDSFQALQRFILTATARKGEQTIHLDEQSIMQVIGTSPQYEQNRNLRWMKQAVEHPELYVAPKVKWKYNPIRKFVFQSISLRYPFTSPVCFTRHISSKRQKSLEAIIEKSKKK